MSEKKEDLKVDDSSNEEVRETEVNENETVDAAEQAEAGEAESADEQGEDVPYEILLQEKIENLTKELAEVKDQYLRRQADYENFRKRMIREKEDSAKYANSNLLLDLVSIIDDFERAIKSSEESKDFDLFHSGIELIEKQFIGTLERKYGLKRFDAVGDEFDPQKHEALMMEDSDEYDVQTVLEDFSKGYMLHERVLRHAKVKVSNIPVKQEKK